MERALTLVNDENKSVYYASKKTDVPYEMLHKCIYDRGQVLSMEEEEQLTVALEYSARC